MLNLGGGSSPGALIVTNSAPNDLLSAAKLPPVIDQATGAPSLRLAEAQCFYSGNCQLAAYNQLRGDPYYNMDARVAKNIKLGETRNLQLIFQGFNIFNHANYGNNFGTTVNANNKDATPDQTFRNPIGFINPTSSLLPRAFTAEFGARFSF
jgi:hypothetical protein